MMILFFVLIIVCVIRSLTLPGAAAGLSFLFIPRWAEATAVFPLPRLLHAAMGQAFFSLSVGIGSMTIFASYIKRNRTLGSEALPVAGLDIAASLLCLLMIFPAAFAFSINVDRESAGLIFGVMPNVLNAMPGTYFWSVLLYVSFFFVAVTTQLAVIENIIAMGMDKFGWTRKKSVVINLFLLMLLILPAALSQSGNVMSGVRIPGLGMNFAAFFPFLVSDNLLPLGSIAYAIFCAYKFGWGWDDFIKETNTGTGWKFPSSVRFWFAYVIPIAGLTVYFLGIFVRFILPRLG
jgi:NSS family neurotransmitter:Na+ symporter